MLPLPVHALQHFQPRAKKLTNVQRLQGGPAVH
jgi:hypothetical protein